MLKIKDDVDLEKLFQKYGFFTTIGNRPKIGMKGLNNHYCDVCWLYIMPDRRIGLETKGDFEDFDTLYDLIKADLVEKVEG